jgi:hypothetical protein
MEVSAMIPLVGELLNLGFKLADLIEKADNISDDDKEAMKAAIAKARDGVTHWNEDKADNVRKEN